MILPEAKQLANEYPISVVEVNDYVATGIPLDKVRVLCDMSVSGASFAVTYSLAKMIRDMSAKMVFETWREFNEEWKD